MNLGEGAKGVPYPLLLQKKETSYIQRRVHFLRVIEERAFLLKEASLPGKKKEGVFQKVEKRTNLYNQEKWDTSKKTTHSDEGKEVVG